MKKIRLNQLDGLRGLFCLVVILTHFPFKDSFFTSNFIVQQGSLFVDFFFVLSGFVISFNYYDRIKNRDDFKEYLVKRFLRLYPLLLYTVIIYLLFEIFFVLFYPALLTHQETIPHLLYLTLDSLTFQNSTLIFGDNLGMNYPSWSISAEMISYIAFGIVVLLFGAKRKVAFVLLFLAAALFLGIKKIYMFEGDWGFVRGIVCFVAGTFSFLLFKKYHEARLPKILEYLVPVALVIIFWFRYYYFEVNGLAAQRELYTLFVIPAFFSLSIFIYALSNGFLVLVLCGRFFQFIGKISYSIYLNHAIVLILVTRTIFSVLKIPKNETSIALSLLLCLVATIIYSHFTFIFIEKKGKKPLAALFGFQDKKKV